MIDLLLLLLVAGLAGALGQALAGFSRGGCLVSIALGFIGALIGTWLSRQFALPELIMLHFGDTAFPLVWAVVGATLFVALIALLTRQAPDRKK